MKDSIAKGHLTLVYIKNSRHGTKVTKFERAVLEKEEVGIALRVFRCLGIDVATDKTASGLYGSRAPLFIAYDAKGRIAGELECRGYEGKSAPLMKLLIKASKGHGKISLASFVKEYRGLLDEIDQIEGKKSALSRKKARLGGDASGASPPQVDGGKPLSKRRSMQLAKIEREERALAKKQDSLVKKERKLLADVKACDQDKVKRSSVKNSKKATGGG